MPREEGDGDLLSQPAGTGGGFGEDAPARRLEPDAEGVAGFGDSAGPGESLDARLAELRALGALDGVQVLTASEIALTDFLRARRSPEGRPETRPAVALLDSGELRAVWSAQAGQVGLRFAGDGRIAYACFAAREGAPARAYGTDTPDRVMGVVEAMGLADLLHG